MPRHGGKAIKPLFLKTRALNLRFVVFVVASVALILYDSGGAESKRLRLVLGTLVYPVQLAVDWPVRLGKEFADGIRSRRALLTENDTLRTRQVLLEAQIQKLAVLQAENARLRELLQSSSRLDDRLSIAEILSMDLDPYRQSIMLNRGLVHQVHVGQPIIDAHGVMGQITHVGLNTSTALLITDTNHSLPIEVNRNGLRTVAQGTGESRWLTLPYLPRNADIREGDLLITSGLGGRFPRGYPVATVKTVTRQGGGRFAQVRAEVTAQVDRSREVLLIWDHPPLDTPPRAEHLPAEEP
ncbi:MAG: rod shape-determining protein MreC [Pseudomonadota bacterium]|jgi:rod shape-determining protein MreC|nr:rod shape-determining protein MreC [Pseudomonadota bacterium]